MNFYKYLTIIFSILMMNFAFAELKTWGMPTDAQEGESPTEEVTPEEGTPEEGTPEEGTPEEGTPEEGTPEEGTPEQDDVPMDTDDSEISEGQPIKFKEEFLVSAEFGSSMPFGTNLKNQFTNGSNLKVDILTPFSFSGFTMSGQLRMLSLVASGDFSENYTDYSVTSLGIALNREIAFLNLNIGTGLSLASGTAMYQPFDDFNMTTLYVSAGVSYDLPLSILTSKLNNESLNNLKMSINLGGIEIFGAPADEGTSDIIDFGLSIGYPFFF